MTTRSWLCALALLTLSACENGSAPLNEPAPASPDLAVVGTYPVPDGVALSDYHMGYVEAEKAASALVYRDRADSWEDVHERVTAHLSAMSAEDAFYLRAVLPSKVLSTYLLPGAPTADKAESARFYVDLMADTGSSDASLALAAAERFGDEWERPYLRRVALQIADNAAAVASGAEVCDGCDELPEQLEAGPDLTVEADRRASATLALRRLADV